MRPVSSGGSDRLQHTRRLCMQCLCAPRCLELVHWLASLPERASVKRVDSRRLERALWAPSRGCCRSVIAVTLPQAELLHVHRPPLHVLLPDLCGCRCRPRLSLSSPHTCTGSSAPASRKFGKFCAPGYSRTVVVSAKLLFRKVSKGRQRRRRCNESQSMETSPYPVFFLSFFTLHDPRVIANFLHECFAHRSRLLEGILGVPQH